MEPTCVSGMNLTDLQQKYHKALELSQRVEVDILIDAIKKFYLIQEGFRRFILQAKVSSKGLLFKIYSALDKLHRLAEYDMLNLNEALREYENFYGNTTAMLDEVILNILDSLEQDLSIALLSISDKDGTVMSASTAARFKRIIDDINAYMEVKSLNEFIILEKCEQENKTCYLPKDPFPKETKIADHCSTILNDTQAFDTLTDTINIATLTSTTITNNLHDLVINALSSVLNLTGILPLFISIVIFNR